MANGDLNWIANFVWGIADDVLRDVYVRGKYRDVIVPMVVIRRLDAILEPKKQNLLKVNEQFDKARVANHHPALCQASGEAFYNVSRYTDGIPKRCFAHMFRDTFALELLLAEVRLDDVSLLLGHKSVKTPEQHYAPFVKARQEQLVAAVQKAWPGERGKKPKE